MKDAATTGPVNHNSQPELEELSDEELDMLVLDMIENAEPPRVELRDPNDEVFHTTLPIWETPGW